MDRAEITEQDKAEITPADIEAAREFCARFGTPLMNAMLDAKAEPAAKSHRVPEAGEAASGDLLVAIAWVGRRP